MLGFVFGREREREILVSGTRERQLLSKGERASVTGVSGGKPCQSEWRASGRTLRWSFTAVLQESKD